MAGPTTPSWRAPPPQPPQAGFTLLELMVSLALVGLLTMVLTGGIRFGARVWEASQVQAEAANEVHAIRRFVRERALAARPVRAIRDGAERRAVGFSGDGAALRLVTLMPAYVARGGLYHFEIAATAGDEGAGMAVKWWPYGGEESGPGSGQRLLLEGAEDIRLSYFGDEEETGAMAWHDAWRGGRDLPRLVSIKVVFPAGDPRVWPELIVALPASSGRANARARN